MSHNIDYQHVLPNKQYHNKLIPRIMVIWIETHQGSHFHTRHVSSNTSSTQESRDTIPIKGTKSQLRNFHWFGVKVKKKTGRSNCHLWEKFSPLAEISFLPHALNEKSTTPLSTRHLLSLPNLLSLSFHYFHPNPRLQASLTSRKRIAITLSIVYQSSSYHNGLCLRYDVAVVFLC